MAAGGRQGGRNRKQSLHFKQEAGRIVPSIEISKRDVLPPTGSHLSDLPKQRHQVGIKCLNVQDSGEHFPFSTYTTTVSP